MSRDLLRMQLYLRVVLPLLEEVVAADPQLRVSLSLERARVQIETRDGKYGAVLRFSSAGLTVEQGVLPRAEVRLRFRDERALNDFFAGKPVIPSLEGLRHPLLLSRVFRLLGSLRVLQPGPTENPSLRVRMVLLLITRGLVELHHGGFEPAMTMVEESPERVYQWSVQQGTIASHVRMKKGKIEAVQGACSHRRPFVHFIFPDVDSALRVFDATGGQVDAVRHGWIQVVGSPEYSRKISYLLQLLDELLSVG